MAGIRFHRVPKAGFDGRRGRLKRSGRAGFRVAGVIPARVAVALLSLVIAGCGIMGPVNPAFPLKTKDAKARLTELRSHPSQTTRPIVVLSGYQDPGFASMSVAARIRRAFTDVNRIITVSFLAEPDFESCREKLVKHVEAAFPSSDPEWTTEVDLVAVSMGGLIARHAARDLEGDTKRLRIARLFTIGTPHRGASMADLPTWDRKQIDMRIGSDFIGALNADPSSRNFEIIPYGRLGDSIVGIENAAPPGANPWWVPNVPLQFAHLSIARDSRIVVDIIQRLRGETPFTIGAPTPPPGGNRSSSGRE